MTRLQTAPCGRTHRQNTDCYTFNSTKSTPIKRQGLFLIAMRIAVQVRVRVQVQGQALS